MSKQVCLIGMFPPPLNGMSLINEYVKKQIAAKATPLVIDFSPCKLDRSLLTRFTKIFRVIRCTNQFISYLMKGQVGSVYMGLSGGYGQIYDLVFACISRICGKKLYLHHHNYQYLYKVRLLTWLLFIVSGKDATHVVACEKMANDLRHLYLVVTKVRVISGIAALDCWSDEVLCRNQIKSIGFLSNICIEKGVLEFLDVAESANQAHMPINFVLAGPYQDEHVKVLVEQRLSLLSNVAYIGAVHGLSKLKFFDSIDVFLFPTKYINESEGLVIHEAMSRGVPVITYSRGCIEQIVSEQVGLCLTPSEDFVVGATGKINEWLSNPRAFQSVSHASVRQFTEAKLLHTINLGSLCAELMAS